MIYASVYEVKTHFSKYLDMIDTGEEDCIVVTRHNKPIAKIIPYERKGGIRLGVAEGKFLVEDGWDSPELNAEIAEMFGV